MKNRRFLTHPTKLRSPSILSHTMQHWIYRTSKHIALSMLAVFASHTPLLAQSHTQHKVIVLVIDGLRPDQITPANMPHLYQMMAHGTVSSGHHSTFPTVTRVNASTISTGVYPQTHGILSNYFYLTKDAPKPLTTGDETMLLQLAEERNGHIFHVPSLSERLTAAGKNFVAITSGSNGGATLLAPEAHKGIATLINGGLQDGQRAAYPDSVNEAIHKRFGSQMSHAGLLSVNWTERVLREYVLPELKPDVVIDWITEPDSSQHHFGVGSPQAVKALQTVDANLGELYTTMQQLHLQENTDLIITADHGFVDFHGTVAINDILKQAHISEQEVGILNDEQTVSFLMRAPDPKRNQENLKALVEVLQESPKIQLIFTHSHSQSAVCSPQAIHGFLPGTFSLELAHLCSADGPDLVATTQIDDQSGPFHQPGQAVAATMTQAPSKNLASHGGLSPKAVSIPLILLGPDFPDHAQVSEPSANIDLTATIASLLGLSAPSLQGHPLPELSPKHVGSITHHTFEVRDHDVCRKLYTTRSAGELYFDSAAAAPCTTHTTAPITKHGPA